MPEQGVSSIEFYWRQGCGFCTSLDSVLSQTSLPIAYYNIWEDPQAAAAVRGIAGGNETVPTVVVNKVAMVNPTPREVVELIRSHASDLLTVEVLEELEQLRLRPQGM
jgi:mycoredoxin